MSSEAHMLYLALLGLGLYSSATQAVKAEVKEYCWGSFNATCKSDEVILMESARYGRMKLGACLQRDYKRGCSADVLEYMDKLCSGRRKCTMRLPNSELHKLQPCPKDILAYLEASYTCIKVIEDQATCTRTGEYNNKDSLSPPSGFLSNLVSIEKGIGRESCPWVINVQPGQKLNITLYNFSPIPEDRSGANMCHMYANIRESTLEVNVCGDRHRTKHVYTSETNRVQIRVIEQREDENKAYFLLKYEAVGCPNPSLPRGAWMTRDKDHMTVTCNSTGVKWHLVCRGTEWVGEFSSCTEMIAVGELVSVTGAFPYGLVIAIIVGIILGVIVGFALLALVMACQRRRQASEAETHAANVFHYTSVMPDGMKTDKTVPEAQYGYAHDWELQHLRSHDDGDGAPPGQRPLPELGRQQSSQSRTSAACTVAVPGRPRDYQYESPRMVLQDRDELVQPGDCHIYHEFDANALNNFETGMVFADLGRGLPSRAKGKSDVEHV